MLHSLKERKRTMRLERKEHGAQPWFGNSVADPVHFEAKFFLFFLLFLDKHNIDLLAPVLNIWMVEEELHSVKVSNVDLVDTKDIQVHHPLPKDNHPFLTPNFRWINPFLIAQ